MSYPHVRDEPARLEHVPDAEIVARYLAADRDGDGNVWIQELFRRHYEKVVTWCLRFAGNRDDAYDLAQGIFVRVQRHLSSFRGDSKFSTWLYSIARSECMSFLKTRSSRRDGPQDDELSEPADLEDSGPHEILERGRSAQLVRALLDRELDETEKQVFTLHYGEDVPLDAITRLLCLRNRSGAKAFIVSARRKLARAVERLRAGEKRLDA